MLRESIEVAVKSPKLFAEVPPEIGQLSTHGRHLFFPLHADSRSQSSRLFDAGLDGFWRWTFWSARSGGPEEARRNGWTR